MTTTEKRRCVGDVTTVRFGDRDVEAEVVSIHQGWILARVKDDPQIPYGYISVRQ